MATVSYEELKRMQRRAEQAGDQQAARELAAKARQSASASGGRESGFGEDVANFGRGVGAGIANTVDSAFGLVGRATGNEDLLNRMNRSKEQRAARNAEFAARSPLAFGGGSLTGELAATAPIGGLGGMAAKGALKAGIGAASGRAMQEGTKKLALTGMAGEGATIGGLYTDEGQDLSSEMAYGALFDMGVGTGLNVVGRPLAEFGRRALKSRKANVELNEEQAKAVSRIDAAREFGGYHLDSLQAAATHKSLQMYNDLKQVNINEGKTDIVNYEKQQELDIRKKVLDLANEFGDGTFKVVDDVDMPITQQLQAYRNSNQVIAESLTFSRMMDEANYENLYFEFDKLAKKSNVEINIQGLNNSLKEVSDEFSGTAFKELRDKINADLQRYGIKAGATVDEVSKGLLTVRKKREGKLTLENSEKLIQDLNAHWNQTLSPSEVRMIEVYKGAIDNHLDDVFGNIDKKLGDEIGLVVETGRAARKARREFSTEWSGNDIVNKIMKSVDNQVGDLKQASRLDADGFSLTDSVGEKLDLTLALTSRNFSVSDMRKLKAKLMTTGDGEKVMNGLAQAPLLEALHAAITQTSGKIKETGVIPFNEKKFRAVINKIDRNKRIELWGKEFTNNLDKSIEAWSLRGLVPDTRGSLNPSGTFTQIVRALRFMPSGRARNYGMAASGMMPQFFDAMAAPQRQRAVEALVTPGASTQAPELVQDRVSSILDDLEQQYLGSAGKRYEDMVQLILRTGGTMALVDE
tara:strand:+ start:3695 stop:5947 length:2253 start_codon:yes stop_codon:yes gene_type:complete